MSLLKNDNNSVLNYFSNVFTGIDYHLYLDDRYHDFTKQVNTNISKIKTKRDKLRALSDIEKEKKVLEYLKDGKIPPVTLARISLFMIIVIGGPLLSGYFLAHNSEHRRKRASEYYQFLVKVEHKVKAINV